MQQQELKPPLELLPVRGLELAARAMEAGNNAAHKPNDWIQGRSRGRYFAKILRHLFKWWAGEDVDPKSGVPHLGHALADLLILLDNVIRDIGTDDRPQQIKREK